MRKLAALTAVVPLLLAGPAALPSPATAAAETCQGQAATIVGTPVQPVLDGTEGPDVIVSGGATTVRALGGDDLVCVTGQTFEVDAGPGGDVVDARERAGAGSTVLGDGADTYLGGPARDDVDAGLDDTGFLLDDARDVIRTGTGGGVVHSGETETTNDDVIVLGRSDTGANHVANKVFYWGQQGSDGRLHFGRGKAYLWVGDASTGSPVWVVDFPRGRVKAGQTWLTWTGAVTDFELEPREIPATEITMKVIGTSEPESVAVDNEVDRVDARLGGGADTVRLPLCGSFSRSLVDLGPGIDTVQVGCDALAVRLHRDHVQPGVEVRGLEVLEVSGTGVEVWGDESRNRISVLGCRGTVHGGAGDDVIKAATGLCPGTLARLHGGRGDDRLIGSPGRDVLVGDRGRDFANGRDGPDLCRAEVNRNCEDT